MARQLDADKTSNAARNTSDNGAKSEGSVEELGYKIFAYPKEGPAETNGQVKTTESWEGHPIVGQNLGTAMDSYSHQKAEIDEETGE